MKIKKLSECHTAAMAVVHAESFSPGWSDADFANYLGNEFDDILGVVDGGTLKGFVLIRTQADQAEILTIVVPKAVRGQGIATDLLIAAEQTARDRGAQIVFLDVAKDNPVAVALYQKNKYVRCGTRPGYYRRAHGRVDALLFQKHL
jgi:ribosomal-protein-alanine N-acetyltransferase